MKLTNAAGLHPLVYRAILAQAKAHPTMKEEPRFASVTELISPACQVALKRRHWADLTEEAEKRIWALNGSALHYILAQGGKGEGAIVEQRLGLNIGGKLITGGFDSFFLEDGWLADYKWCKVWALVFEDSIEDWQAQINIYAEMLRRDDADVKKLSLELFFKDWKRGEMETDRRSSAKRGKPMTYPAKDWQRLPVDIWSSEKVMAYSLDCVLKLQEALDADVPVECNKRERWDRETTWAVYRNKNKNATKVFYEKQKKETRADAETWMTTQKKPDEYYIVDRPGKRNRCENYCIAAQVCPHWKAYQESLYGRNFGPDPDEETTPPEMSGAKDMWGCTPKPRKTGVPPVRGDGT